MPRKATFNKDAPFTAQMAESYFGAIKHDFDSLRGDLDGLRSEFVGFKEYVEKRFNNVDATLITIFSIINVYDVERKEIKATLWEHDRRLAKVEV